MLRARACRVKGFCANLAAMDGGDLLLWAMLGSVWLFVFGGMAMNASSWWIGLHAKEGERVASGVLFVFGILGAGLAYFSFHVLERRYAITVSWPWLWILLPLFLDVYCLGGLVLALLGFTRREDAKDESR